MAGPILPAWGSGQSLVPSPIGSTGGPWQLTFHDEFDGPGLDPAKWSNGFGWGASAGHETGYCDPANNYIQAGVLIQRVLNQPAGGMPYSAACINTKETFSQLYGFWEARMKVPPGRGLYSAFWGKSARAWPPELDVMEIPGGISQRVTMSVHWRQGLDHMRSNHRFYGPDFSAGYHVFGAEWTPTQTIWYVDGVEQWRTSDGAATMGERGPFYMILNMQVNLVGAQPTDSSTPWPSFQYVDYVRAWSRPSPPTPPTPLPPVAGGG
jgi:beta-glucanase (GH16 family)